MPLIFAGIRTAALFVVSTTTIAALTGYSGSLGDIINNETSYHLSGVLGAAICIAALALVVEVAARRRAAAADAARTEARRAGARGADAGTARHGDRPDTRGLDSVGQPRQEEA